MQQGFVAPTGVAVLAQDPAPPPGKGEEFGSASPVALAVLLVLAVATALLIRNMTKRIRRLPESFDPPAAEEPPAQADEPTEDADSARS